MPAVVVVVPAVALVVGVVPGFVPAAPVSVPGAPDAGSVAATGSAPMTPPFVLLSTGAVTLRSRVPACRIVPPRLSMSLALLSSTFAPSRVPVFSSRPAAVTTSPPAPAPMCPALRTPTPASVPTNVILPAYMPPSAATSSAKLGAAPLPVVGVVWLLSALTWFAPATTFSSFAQMPALTCTARARMAA